MFKNTFVKDDGSSFIIAEMSSNHLQNLDRAKAIIKEAKNCGADAIKLQTYLPNTITLNCRNDNFLATKGSPWEGHYLYELYEKSYMPWQWYDEIFSYAEKIGIICFSSPFDFSAVDLLEKYNVPMYKVASYEIKDIPLIEKIAKLGKPIILSTGIATLEDIELAVNCCKKCGNNDIAILKCVSEYPSPYEDINLKTIPNMMSTFNCTVGLSDHSLGDTIPIAAISLGAKIIEKHLTLSRSDGGSDAIFSMEPFEFKQMVCNIRNVEKALGKVTYALTEKQQKCLKNVRSLYIVEDIKKGDILTEKNIRSVRPGQGLHPKYYNDVLGKKFRQNVIAGTPLSWDLIE